MQHPLYTFIHLWTLRLFLYLGYCESCCNKHGCTFFNILFSFPLGIYPKVELLDHMVNFIDRELSLWGRMKYSALPGCPTHRLSKRKPQGRESETMDTWGKKLSLHRKYPRLPQVTLQLQVSHGDMSRALTVSKAQAVFSSFLSFFLSFFLFFLSFSFFLSFFLFF